MKDRRRSATIKDVALRAGVSVGTVSNFINETKPVLPATAQRIEQAIGDLGFVPNRTVRTLHGNRASVIGFVVPDATNPFFTELARHVEDVARSNGCVVVFCDTAGDPQREVTYLRNLAEMRVGGVILTAVDNDDVKLGDLESVRAPLVLLGDEKPGFGASSVVLDHWRSGYLAMNHLLSLGRREILYAGGPGGPRVLEARFQGAEQAVREHPDAAKVTFTRRDAAGRTVTDRAALVDTILTSDRRPDGVICVNDVTAVAILNALLRRGIRVPEDIAIVGHDDVEAASQAVIPITTVRQPIEQLGRLAAELLFRDEEHSPVQHLVFQPELVVRESTVASEHAVHLQPGDRG
jgi:LacI family transcriptional regulator